MLMAEKGLEMCRKLLRVGGMGHEAQGAFSQIKYTFPQCLLLCLSSSVLHPIFYERDQFLFPWMSEAGFEGNAMIPRLRFLKDKHIMCQFY